MIPPSIYLSMVSEYTACRDRLIAPDEAILVLEEWVADVMREAYQTGRADDNRRASRLAWMHVKLLTRVLP